MNLPIEIIYEIAYYCDILTIASLSCTCKQYNVFYDENVWKMKCNNNKNKYDTFMDAYVGVKVPLIHHGDFVKYIRCNSKQIYPSLKYFATILASDRGATIYYITPNTNTIIKIPGFDNTFAHGVHKAVLIEPPTDLKNIHYNTIRNHVDDEMYSSKSKIPIYGYTVEHFECRTIKEEFNILENVSIIPKVTPLLLIPRENKLLSLIDGIRLTKIHSLESILRHFITEEKINCMNEEQMREQIKIQLTLIHHILPNRIAF